jgi:hypothetical protein
MANGDQFAASTAILLLKRLSNSDLINDGDQVLLYDI